MRKKEGILFVVSAPSGAGKTSLCRAAKDAIENLWYSVSFTTRSPRPGEVDGKDYCFVPVERFREMVRAGDFAEWAEVHSNLYGTSGKMLEEMRVSGIDVILDIDTQGARQIRSRYVGQAVFIFIMPPSLEVLEERLRNRKSDHENEIKKRMQRAKDEMKDYALYDYVIVNKDFEQALMELKSVITAQRCRTEYIAPDRIKDLVT